MPLANSDVPAQLKSGGGDEFSAENPSLCELK
jgi:hypothetical protein